MPYFWKPWPLKKLSFYFLEDKISVFFTRGQIAERVKNIWDFVCLFVLLSPPTFPPLSFDVKRCFRIKNSNEICAEDKMCHGSFFKQDKAKDEVFTKHIWIFAPKLIIRI